MINLLPNDFKTQLRAARTNVLLIRYFIVILFAALFLGLILGGSLYLLEQTRVSAQKLIDANDTKAEVYSSTQAQVEALSASLAGTKSILDQEVSYSKVLMNIGQQMPPNTILEKLTLNQSAFSGTALTLKAYAKSNDDAVALRQAFQGSPLFSNVNFQDVSDGSSGVAGYPVTVTMTLTINKAAGQ